ncbi:hypothetical protein BJ508DRAFT_308706 [Ascobolus immersus RN42]|uniref:C2H2-type domain-containing protein n=1 Tax=Ascobolus immersus RN42 TaxID=1160509 RepID=A0A3N4I106_ASCIM|nr:hypothetical protein BJ508DRAFT_308706 [Ascobolus immersus RN42]
MFSWVSSLLGWLQLQSHEMGMTMVATLAVIAGPRDDDALSRLEIVGFFFLPLIILWNAILCLTILHLSLQCFLRIAQSFWLFRRSSLLLAATPVFASPIVTSQSALSATRSFSPFFSSPIIHQPTTPPPTLEKPVSRGQDQFSWISRARHHLLRCLRACAIRTRPVFWIVRGTECHSIPPMAVANTRKVGPRERPDELNVSLIACHTLPKVNTTLEMQLSSMSPLKPFGPLHSLTKLHLHHLPQSTALSTNEPEVCPVVDLAASVPLQDQLRVRITLGQLAEWAEPRADPVTAVLAVARQLGLTTVPDEVVLHLARLPAASNPLQNLQPTLSEVITTVVSFCQSLQPLSRELPAGPPQLVPAVQPSPTLTPKCTTLPPSISVAGSNNMRRKWPNEEATDRLSRLHGPSPVFEVTRTALTTRNQRRRRQRRKSRFEAKQLVNEPLDTISNNESLDERNNGRKGKDHTNDHYVLPSHLLLPCQNNPHHPPNLFPPASPFPPQTTMSNSSPNIYMQPSIELVREALKLETAGNPKAATLIQRINRVRHRYGQAGWDELRQHYPRDITYEPADFSTLRRQFLDLYESWQQAVQGPSTPPAELLGQRRQRATAALPPNYSPGPMPLPVALQDPETPARRAAVRLPASAWLSSAGARLSTMFANFPSFSPRSPTPSHHQLLPGEYPSSSEHMGTNLHLELEDDTEGFLPELSLILPAPIGSPRRTESLYSDDTPSRVLPSSPTWNLRADLWSDIMEPDSLPPVYAPQDAPQEEALRDEQEEDATEPFEVGEESIDEQVEAPYDQSLVFHRPEMSYYPHQPLFTQNYFHRNTSEAPPGPRDESFSSPSPFDDVPLGRPQQNRARSFSSSSSLSHSSSSPNNEQEVDHTFLSLRKFIVPLHTPTQPRAPSPPVTTSSPIMASLTADQFNTLLAGMKEALKPASAKPAFKDVKTGIFYPNLPVDQSHPAGRSCVVNGITYYRNPRLMKGEVDSLLMLVEPADLIQNLPTLLEGAGRTWWRDILTKTEREDILKDATCKLFTDKLIAQFERQDEDPLSTVFENRFTTARLKAGDDFFSWIMETTAILTAAGLDESRKLKTLYACLDSDLKNEFGPPGERTMQQYLAAIQTKAHVYRAKLLQQEQENRFQQAKVLNDLVQVFRENRGTGSVNPPVMPQATPRVAPASPLSITVTSQAQPFTGRPCRHCGGSHLDNACPSRPAAVSRACRFCGQMHMDHACPQRPAGFKNCSNCGGPHYFSVCPTQKPERPANTGAFSNMQVGQPSNPAQIQSAGFVQSTSPEKTESRWSSFSSPGPSTPASSMENRCGSCHASFATHQALYGHAVLTGHQIDAEQMNDDSHYIQVMDYGYRRLEYAESAASTAYDPVQSSFDELRSLLAGHDGY